MLDIALAAAIASISLVPLLMYVYSVPSNRIRVVAPSILRALLVAVDARAHDDFDSVQSRTYTAYGFSVSEQVSLPTAYIKKITLTVSWGLLPWQRMHQTLYATKYLRAQTSSSCSYALVWDDWSQLEQVYQSPLPASTTPTDIVLFQGAAFVSLDSAVATATDLIIFDVTNPQTTHQLSAIDTGTGIAQLAIFGTHIYAAHRSNTAGLQVITIADVYNPVLAHSVPLPGVSALGQSGMGTAIVTNGATLFVGTSKNTGGEIVRFSLDSAHAVRPQFVATYEIGAGINDLVLEHDALYIASPLNTAELMRYDVSTSSTDLLHQRLYDAPGGSGNGKALSFAGDTLFLGRTVGNAELHALSSTAFTTHATLTVDESVQGLITNGRWLFGALTSPARALSVFTTGSENNQLLSRAATYPLPGRARSLACWFNTIAVVSENPSLLTIYTRR